MRDSMKITVPYQFFSVFVMHLAGAVVAFVFQTFAFWYFIEKPVSKEILGVIFTIIYFGMMYMRVNKLAKFDYKSYTPLKPSVFKGVMFGAAISAVTFLMYIIYRYIWANFVGVDGLTGIPAIMYNFIFAFWTFPYYGLMGMSNGHITLIGHILIYAVPVIASTTGYIAAKYKLDILEKINNFTYEKSDD